MLTQIRCDRFLDEYKIINFNAGLNTVLGSTGGNNAIGKTTFLQIIDYAFGGEEYSKSYLRDIKTHVGDVLATIRFSSHLSFQRSRRCIFIAWLQILQKYFSVIKLVIS